MTRKSCVWRASSSQPHNAKLKDLYKSIASDCRRAIFLHQVNLKNKIIDSGKIGDFYKYANGKLASRTGIGPLKLDDGSFASVCVDDNGLIPSLNGTFAGPKLERVSVTPQDVAAKLRTLKGNSSAGPDGLPPIFFKTLSQTLSAPLALMFNSFLSIGGFPDHWRSATVTPIFKKGDITDVNSIPSNFPNLCM